MHSTEFWLLAGLAVSTAASGVLETRQDDTNSTCLVYGINYIDGGTYFVDSNSESNFTAVQLFEDCNKDDAYVLLVQQSTEDEWECSMVPTGTSEVLYMPEDWQRSLTRFTLPVPDNTPQMSTCPIEQDQMPSGEWIIIVIGNNADGNPFAYQRDFSLIAGYDGLYYSLPVIYADQALSDRKLQQPSRRL